MKYFIPEIEVSIENGFTEDIDIFNRKPLGENLAVLLKNSDQNLVISIDNKWGEGKTTFIKMWQGHLKKNHDIESIYFDAFANDHIEDPFSALLAELYQFVLLKIPNESKLKEDFKEKAKKASIAILKGGLKVGIRYATMNVLDGGFLDGNQKDSNKTDKAIADELVSMAENTAQHYLDNYSQTKAQIEQFKYSLERVVQHISPNGPLVFIVDELDRCKPSYSVELLEKLKHVFSVPNVHFILSINRKQLEASIKGQYGQEVNSNLYLQKFIQFSVTLPMKSRFRYFYRKKFIKDLFVRAEIPSTTEATQAIQYLEEMAEHIELSFRGCERVFSLLTIQIGSNRLDFSPLLIALLCIKIVNIELFNDLESNMSIELFEKVEKELKINKDNYLSLPELVQYIYLDLRLAFSIPINPNADKTPSTSFDKTYLAHFSQYQGYGFPDKFGGVYQDLINISFLT
jgi:hypothetical protein